MDSERSSGRKPQPDLTAKPDVSSAVRIVPRWRFLLPPHTHAHSEASITTCREHGDIRSPITMAEPEVSIVHGSDAQTRPSKSNKVKLACQRCRDKRTKVDAMLTESRVRTHLFHSATGKDLLAPSAPKPGRRVSMLTLMALEASLAPLFRMPRPG